MRLPLPMRPLGRNKQDEKRVPLKIMKPIKLRNHVSGKGENSGQVPCLQEMTVMMACLKASEYDQVTCSQEISKFQNCVTTSKKEWLEKDEMLKKGVTVGAKKLNHLQINKILQKFPAS